MPDRHTVDSITSDELDELYDGLDRYEELQGEMNERAIDLTRRCASLETTLREVLDLFAPAATLRDNGAVLAYAATEDVIDPARMNRWLAVLGPPAEQPARTTPNNPTTSKEQ